MSDKEEVDRLMNVLRTAIRLLGLSNREIERRLSLTPSYISRLFAGAIELKVEHVMAITRAVGLQPWEFFELAYPNRSENPSEAFRSIRRLLRGMQPLEGSVGPPVVTDEDIDRKVHDAVRRVLGELATGTNGK
ncbi:MAG TPA: helix-turn-helix transcriptional regulator [Thermoanaerobaculia bacterium]|jgi:transcriptional regulator with XRE-family HTH domain